MDAHYVSLRTLYQAFNRDAGSKTAFCEVDRSTLQKLSLADEKGDTVAFLANLMAVRNQEEREQELEKEREARQRDEQRKLRAEERRRREKRRVQRTTQVQPTAKS